MASELENAIKRVDRWANYEWTTADQIAVESEISTFTAGDLRLILSANREMREALRPFSALADMVGESWTDETPAFVGADGVTITIGQLRKARSALTTQRGDGE